MEYDCGMFDRHRVLPAELGQYCTDEVASHSNAGIGIDPQLRYNCFGGEVQVAPSNSESGLLRRILTILDTQLATDQLAYPGTIHVHVRVPQLFERPDLIRLLVRRTTDVWPAFAERLWLFDNRGASPYNAWLEDCNDQVKSTVYDAAALHRMEGAADDPAEIARALHNWPKAWNDWKNEWHIETNKVKRPAVNFGHLAINQTIEFRSFATTVNPQILRNIIAFPLRFLRALLSGDPRPTRIIDGLQFQDVHALPADPHYGETSLYFVHPDAQRHYLAVQLVNGDLTLADLNYPEFWIKKGFQ